jgi:hypothetical protein
MRETFIFSPALQEQEKQTEFGSSGTWGMGSSKDGRKRQGSRNTTPAWECLIPCVFYSNLGNTHLKKDHNQQIRLCFRACIWSSPIEP